jgi:hypothetical protein
MQSFKLAVQVIPRSFNRFILILLTLVFSTAAQAASVAIGNLTFDETAFADEIGTITITTPPDEFVTFLYDGGGNYIQDSITLETALTDNDINTGAWCQPQAGGNQQGPCSIELEFTDNDVFNLPGNDLLLFEQGTLEPLDVIIGGEKVSLLTGDAVTNPTINDNNGSPMNLYYIDLDDFNIPLGAMINLVTLDLIFTSEDFFYSADPMLLVSLNPVPVPAAVWLFGTALIGLVGFSKKKAT